jgi:hypothetical protein
VSTAVVLGVMALGLTGLDKTEVVIPRSSRSVYDHAVRNCGDRVRD